MKLVTILMLPVLMLLVPLSREVRDGMMHCDDVIRVVTFIAGLPPVVRIDEIAVLPDQFPLKLWDYRVE